MATATLAPNNAVHPSFPTPEAYNPASVEAPISSTATNTTADKPPSLHAAFNYYLPAADGSPPRPSYVDKPETFYRPTDPRVLPVRDIRGEEQNYTLDTAGFQVVKHTSAERDFLDEDQIKRVYYPEVESILKEASVFLRRLSFLSFPDGHLYPDKHTAPVPLKSSSLITPFGVKNTIEARLMMPGKPLHPFAAPYSESMSTSPTKPRRIESPTICHKKRIDFSEDASKSSTYGGRLRRFEKILSRWPTHDRCPIAIWCQ